MSNFSHTSHNKQRAFTLVELVISIVILALLAAFVLPRFSDLRESSQIAQAEGIAGSFRAAAFVVKSVFRSQGHSTRVQNLQGFGDGTIDTNNIGLPIGVDKGNGNENIGRQNKGCAELWNGILQDPPSVAHNNNNQSYRSYRHTGSKACSYVYRDGGDNGDQNSGLIVIKYDSRDGNVTVCGQSPLLSPC